MRGASLLLVFLVAKLAIVWGHSAPLTCLALLAYVWQDAMIALAFAALDISLEKMGATTRIAWAIYWAVAIYAAINIPVGRVVFTPLTWPMLRAARGPLADSMLEYVTASNVLLVVAVLAAAAGLPRLLRQVPRQFVRMGLVCTIAVVLLGPMASSRVDTRGMDRNVITALVGSGLPRVAARAGAGDWRESRFQTDRATEDLVRFAGSARGLNVVIVSLESTAAQYLPLYGAPDDGGHDVMPNLSTLARRALVFENAYAVYPESIKGLFSVLCSTFPAFDSRPEEYENVECSSVAAVLADAGYRTAMFHSGRFRYLGMEAIINGRGYQTLEDAGDIGGNHNSSFGVDEPATVARMLAWIDGLPRGQRFFLTYLPIAGHHILAHCRPSPLCHSGARSLRGNGRDRSIPQRPTLWGRFARRSHRRLARTRAGAKYRLGGLRRSRRGLPPARGQLRPHISPVRRECSRPVSHRRGRLDAQTGTGAEGGQLSRHRADYS